jgi:C4-dicarboxylate-specific signal transduction histidine kinase
LYITARSLIRSIGLAFVLVTAALIPELFLVKRFFPYPFLFLFFGAVMASAWFEGMIAGFFAVLFSILAVDYFFIPPINSFVINAAVGAYIAAFVLCALVASWVSSSKKKSEKALKEARDQLEIRVNERTADLMHTQAELTRLSRVLSMGELTASIAHEIKQPLTAVVTHGHACIQWLSTDPPNLAKATQTVERIIQEGTRAGAVINRIRALFKKDGSPRDWVSINEIIQELMVLLRHEAISRQITIQTDLDPAIPKIKGDRVQLQQVILNLMMNGMDAMDNTAVPRKQLFVRSGTDGTSAISVCIEDQGAGVDPETGDKLFDPFFTTKSNGIGMGLSISRSIIEAHEGRLWAEPCSKGGSIFQFTIPVESHKF